MGVTQGMLRALAGYLAAVAVTYVTAVIHQTQSVMANLHDMGVEVSLGERLSATAHDLAGMATTFLPMIAVGLAIAFPVAWLIIRRLPFWRPVGYALAGGVAMLTIHVALQTALDITPVAAARTSLGLTLQALCGALGGWVLLNVLPRSGARGARTDG